MSAPHYTPTTATGLTCAPTRAAPTEEALAARLRLEPTGSARTLLDGGWWPRSTDPLTELPGLVLAIDPVHGPVTRLVLGADGWDSHPRRLVIAGRVLRLGWFASQPASLLTAICLNGDRVDLLVVPRRARTTWLRERWPSRPPPAIASTPRSRVAGGNVRDGLTRE